MNLRTTVVAVVAVFLAGAVAMAAVCPLCLRSIPDGEKYCERHKAEMVAKSVTSTDEAKLVNDLQASRAEYRTRLEAMEKFYKDRGNAEGLHRVQTELADHDKARQFAYLYWEDKLTDLNATTANADADKLLAEADAMRGKFGPFSRGDRYREAAGKYQQILINYPSSTAVTGAAFGLGEIYSSGVVAEYPRAVKFFELAYLSNPKTPLEAVFRAAQICDNELSEYSNAARYYWMAARMSQSAVIRKRAAMRLAQLQKGGFGKDYTVVEEKKEAAPADEGEKK